MRCCHQLFFLGGGGDLNKCLNRCKKLRMPCIRMWHVKDHGHEKKKKGSRRKAFALTQCMLVTTWSRNQERLRNIIIYTFDLMYRLYVLVHFGAAVLAFNKSTAKQYPNVQGAMAMQALPANLLRSRRLQVRRFQDVQLCFLCNWNGSIGVHVRIVPMHNICICMLFYFRIS